MTKRGRRRSATASARRAGRRFARLVGVMATLRSRHGCPWDRQQTHATLSPFLIEEAYEVIEAIDRGALDALPEELGDVLFQCVFQSQVAAEAGRFDVADAIDAIVGKLVRRHPHVFTASGRPLSAAARRRRRARTSGAVLEQWEAIKAKERSDAGARARVLAGIPRAMPALLRAHEIGTRTAAVGFDWPAAADVMAKVEEEVGELGDALARQPDRAGEEMGDLLFSLANLARHLGIEPESALRKANDKFTSRFEAVEDRLARDGRTVHDASTAEMDRAWQAVKAEEQASLDRRGSPAG
jgi:ATP diphosphatase